MAKGNRMSATEDDLGILHKGITKAFTRKVEVMNKAFEEAEEMGDQVGMQVAIDSRDLAAASKWVQANEITCSSPEDHGSNALKDQLEALKEKQKGKVVGFTR